MCLIDPKIPKKSRGKVIGYRAAYKESNGKFTSCHQQCWKELAAGVPLKATGPKGRAGFHVFFAKKDAMAYHKGSRDCSGNGNCVIKVQCEEIWRVGTHRAGSGTAKAFTCGKMTILDVIHHKPKPKKWQKYVTGYGPVAVSARKPNIKTKQKMFDLHDTCNVNGSVQAVVSFGKSKTGKLVPVNQLWVLA